jgi:hypothetical protein
MTPQNTFSAFTHKGNVFQKKDMPFHWHIATSNFDLCTDMLDIITGKVGMYQHSCTYDSTRIYEYFPSAFLPTKIKEEWYLRDEQGNKIPWSDKLPNYYFLDLRNLGCQTTIINRGIQRATYLGLKWLCWDNCYHQIKPKQIPIKLDTWTQTSYAFAFTAAMEAKKWKMKTVCNVACPVELIPEMLNGGPRKHTIGMVCNGILSENPFDPRGDERAELLAWKTFAARGCLGLLRPPKDRYDHVMDLIKGTKNLYACPR